MRRLASTLALLVAGCGGAESTGTSTTTTTTGWGGSTGTSGSTGGGGSTTTSSSSSTGTGGTGGVTSTGGAGGTTTTASGGAGGTGGDTGSTTASTTTDSTSSSTSSTTSTPGCQQPADCPGVDVGCAVRTCDAGLCGTILLSAGAACAQGGGKVCDGQGACVGCLSAAECANGEACVQHACAAPTCTDQVKDGAETDVDCGGGTCPPCAASQHCTTNADCLSTWCSAGICLLPDCVDGVKNGPETDVDCGGPLCAKCLPGQHCLGAGDCVSAVCAGGVCLAPTCFDATRNAAETDVDCGGGTCPPCAAGKACGSGADCQSASCQGGVCQGISCTDAIRNGSESDVDCGGGACPGCAAGKICNTPADCQSASCQGNLCQAPSCFDGIQNQGETDFDCGGAACPKCNPGQHCGVAADCKSAVCTGGSCQAATCTDGVKNGQETGVDCGGPSCPICPTVLLAGSSVTGVFGAELHPGGSWAGATLSEGSAFAPSLTFTSTGQAVLAIRSELGPGDLRAALWTGTGWGGFTTLGSSAKTRAQPSVESAGGAVAHLLFQDNVYQHHYLAYSAATGWTPVQQPLSSPVSYGPVPGTITAVGSLPTAAYINGEPTNVNWVSTRDRVGGVWQPRVDLAGNTNYNLTPVIAALSAGPELMVVYVQSDTKILFTTRTAGAWSAPVYINNCLTNDRVALAALPGGGALLAFRGTDGYLYWSRWASGAWSAVAPFATPNVQVSATPAVAHGIGGPVAELAYVGIDGKAYHARLSGAAWSTPVQVGGAQLVGVALATSP